MLTNIVSALLGGIAGALLVLQDRDRLILECTDLRKRNAEVTQALRAIEERVSVLHADSGDAECARALHEICRARMQCED